MNRPVLMRHGEITKPAYKQTAARADQQPELSTDAMRPDGNVTGIVKRFRHTERTAEQGTALELIKRTYPEALEYATIPARLRGLMAFMGLLGLALTGLIAVRSFSTVFTAGIGDARAQMNLIFGSVFAVIGIYIVVKAFRFEMFRPVDEPIIFDRKNRRVYRLFREVQPGILGNFMPWPMRAAEYNWDLIDAEHNAQTVASSSTLQHYNSLVLYVRKSPGDPAIIDSFNVGNAFELDEVMVAPLWEHIRRFMEEGGPHLPAGERVANAPAPVGLWASMGVVGPFGPEYIKWWRERTVQMVFYHLLAPVTVPMFGLWGFLNWLSYRTAVKAEWPDEVLRAVS